MGNSNPVYTCNSDNTAYTVSFDITGGNDGPYNYVGVLPNGIGGSFTGNTFTSDEIPSGTAFEFVFDEDGGCGSQTVTGTFNCGCQQQVGTMSTTPIETCGNGELSGTYNPSLETIPPGSLRQYVLHNSPSNILGAISQSGNNPSFSLTPAMTYGVTYYVSAVVGIDDGTGNVDLNDPCTVAAAGTPVTWNEIPTTTASASDEDLCEGENLELFASTFGSSNYTWTRFKFLLRERSESSCFRCGFEQCRRLCGCRFKQWMFKQFNHYHQCVLVAKCFHKQQSFWPILY